jgi:phage baseplate assembly protein W|tara:strand:- start:2066 stop:2473 length:408 start_codon:yes stop_codon:yes gene_type:complete
MAFNAKRINPIDQQPSKAVGVSLPFSGKAVFNSTFETKEAIKSNLINYLLTGRGERYMNPTFGSGLRNQMFTNVNRENLSTLEVQIAQELEDFFPSLSISKLNITGVPDSNMISLSLNFLIRDTLVQDELTINFE